MPNKVIENNDFSFDQWEIPIPFQGVVMNLPKGMLLDWSYIMLAKSRELLSLGVSLFTSLVLSLT